MDKKYKNTTGKIYMLFSVVPTIIFCIVMLGIFIRVIYNVKNDDTKVLLKSCAKELVYSYEMVCADRDFEMIDDVLFVGDEMITNDFSIVDRLKDYANVDFSLFWKDSREVTTICDESNKRIVKTKSTNIWNNYVSQGEEYFDTKADVNGRNYFAYYVPVRSKDGDIVGMGFAGIPSSEFTHLLILVIRSCIGAMILLTFCVVLCVIFITRHHMSLQEKVFGYLKEVGEGNYKHPMDEKMIARRDEYGEMSVLLVKMNDSLSSFVERDPLTGLYNRRAGMKKLADYMTKANSEDAEAFTVTICDIDYFKKVNDTYGHNCGDQVLKEVAKKLRKELSEDLYYAIRWGGEEFVVLQKGNLEESKKEIEKIADEIRNMKVAYEENEVSVTMTFGMVEYIPNEKLEIIISRADKLLYKGKKEGRNCINSQ